jgi:hypothetical protein
MVDSLETFIKRVKSMSGTPAIICNDNTCGAKSWFYEGRISYLFHRVSRGCDRCGGELSVVDDMNAPDL